MELSVAFSGFMRMKFLSSSILSKINLLTYLLNGSLRSVCLQKGQYHVHDLFIALLVPYFLDYNNTEVSVTLPPFHLT